MSSQTVVFGLVEAIIPLMPGMHERLGNGSRVLDVGCGSGRFTGFNGLFHFTTFAHHNIVEIVGGFRTFLAIEVKK